MKEMKLSTFLVLQLLGLLLVLNGLHGVAIEHKPIAAFSLVVGAGIMVLIFLGYRPVKQSRSW